MSELHVFQLNDDPRDTVIARDADDAWLVVEETTGCTREENDLGEVDFVQRCPRPACSTHSAHVRSERQDAVRVLRPAVVTREGVLDWIALTPQLEKLRVIKLGSSEW